MSIYSTSERVESPLNYSGSKYKILDFLIENLPEDINTFIDLFGGGFNVGINIRNANKIVYNDYNTYVKELVEVLYRNDSSITLDYIESRIEEFDLSYGSKNYYKLRDLYNKTHISDRNPLDLYVLILYGFQHQIRFNRSHGFNNPIGKSGYNESIKQKIKKFSNGNSNVVEFISQDFRKFLDYDFNEGDFVYCDPPYLITSAAYNDGGKRGFDGWDEKIEKEFLDFLIELNSQSVRFMLSNVLEHKGKKNVILEEWVKKNNFKMKLFNDKRKEVLVMNY
jgi:DNA adenine methylase Dam